MLRIRVIFRHINVAHEIGFYADLRTLSAKACSRLSDRMPYKYLGLGPLLGHSVGISGGCIAGIRLGYGPV